MDYEHFEYDTEKIRETISKAQSLLYNAWREMLKIPDYKYRVKSGIDEDVNEAVDTIGRYLTYRKVNMDWLDSQRENGYFYIDKKTNELQYKRRYTDEELALYLSGQKKLDTEKVDKKTKWEYNNMTRLDKNDNEMNDPHVEFNGELFSIGLVRRTDGHGDWMLQLFTEDDGNKFLVTEVDSEWVWDLSKQLEKAKKFILDSRGLHE